MTEEERFRKLAEPMKEEAEANRLRQLISERARQIDKKRSRQISREEQLESLRELAKAMGIIDST